MHEQDQQDWKGPLHGIRVLDFTRVLAGPAASLALADLGAEVIKVEPPGAGDETRTFPPFRNGESHYFLSINRGKKSIVLDLKSAAGVDVAKDLAAKCDIVIENYRPGIMDKLGLGYETLSASNPGLIYCSISGFGQDSPLRDRPSFDIVLKALSGALSVNGEPGAPPTKLGIPMGDLVGGINGPIGILAALHERNSTGKGRFIDISLLDGMIGLLGYLAQLAFFTGENPTPQGSQHPNLVPYGQFPAKDGNIVIACLTNSFWERVCGALERIEWIDDPRFDSLEKRKENRELVNSLISEITQRSTVSELEQVFIKYEVPHSPVLGITEALQQPHAVARNLVVETDHATLGPTPVVNRPIKFSEEVQAAPTAPPVLGEHTNELLSELLGLDEQQIKTLRSSGAVK